MTVAIGSRVRFDSMADLKQSVEKTKNIVTGTVVYINRKHRWFSVEYGEPKQRFSFLFSDIGKKVRIL